MLADKATEDIKSVAAATGDAMTQAAADISKPIEDFAHDVKVTIVAFYTCRTDCQVPCF